MALPIGPTNEYHPRRPNRLAQLDTLSQLCLADHWTPVGSVPKRERDTSILSYPVSHSFPISSSMKVRQLRVGGYVKSGLRSLDKGAEQNRCISCQASL